LPGITEDRVLNQTLNLPKEFPQAEKLENKPIFPRESTLAAAGCQNMIQV